MFRSMIAVAAGLLAGFCIAATPEPAGSRGQLLYTTYCDACHTSDIHWREKRLATDFASLLAEVRRWQAIGGLGWEEADIVEVARYLNEAIYHFALPEERVFLEGDAKLR